MAEKHGAGRYRLVAASFRQHHAGDVVELTEDEAQRLVKPNVFEPLSKPILPQADPKR